jgi:hypothetical protein
MENQTKKKKVGRPKFPANVERKNCRTCSITPSTEKAAKKRFKTLGMAIEYAVMITNSTNL